MSIRSSEAVGLGGELHPVNQQSFAARAQQHVPPTHEPLAEATLRPKNETLLEIAEHALKVVEKQSLTQQEAKQVVDETVRYWTEHVNVGFLQYRKSVADGGGYTSVEWRDPLPGSVYFQDVHGRMFIDCLGGFGIYNVGHRHPAVVGAVQAQLHKQALHSQELLDPLRTYTAHLLAQITPGNGVLKYHFFINSGTEAVEACIKLALLATGRKLIISFINAFHGKTLGSLAATSKSNFRQPFIGALLNVQHLPFNDCDALRMAFKAAKFSGNEIAGVILEPIQGEGGIHVATDEFLRTARQLCDEHGSVLIFDEVQSGMGRTGLWWGCDHAGVVPDCMAIGKAFGGGVMPAAACVAKEWVWTKYIENPFLFTTTFGGNPLAMAAAIATINVLLKENLLEHATREGQYFIDKFKNLQRKFPHILREVRGRGFMIGLEFQTNESGVAFSRGMFARNILVSGTLVNALCIRIEPPLTITREEIDIVLASTEDTLVAIDRQLKTGATVLQKLPIRLPSATVVPSPVSASTEQKAGTIAVNYVSDDESIAIGAARVQRAAQAAIARHLKATGAATPAEITAMNRVNRISATLMPSAVASAIVPSAVAAHATASFDDDADSIAVGVARVNGAAEAARLRLQKKAPARAHPIRMAPVAAVAPQDDDAESIAVGVARVNRAVAMAQARMMKRSPAPAVARPTLSMSGVAAVATDSFDDDTESIAVGVARVNRAAQMAHARLSKLGLGPVARPARVLVAAPVAANYESIAPALAGDEEAESIAIGVARVNRHFAATLARHQNGAVRVRSSPVAAGADDQEAESIAIGVARVKQGAELARARVAARYSRM